MLVYSSLLVFIWGCHNALAAGPGYQGYKIYDIFLRNEKEIDLLHVFCNGDPDYDFFTLTRILHRPARVMVPPVKQDKFIDFLSRNRIKYHIVNSNVGETIKKSSQKVDNLKVSNDDLGTDRYHSHEDINKYIEKLATEYRSRVFVETVGKSFENRLLKTIRITNGDGRKNKGVIFVDGGFHAREWISPATVLHLINQLVKNSIENDHLVKDFDWIILPVVNVDGYEYTRSSPERRLWRKTRRPSGIWKGKECIGTDPNRNFNFHWNEGGASSNPCSDIYAGEEAFSEPETQVVRDILLSLKDRGIMYLTLHSYGCLLLYPWGWTTALPDGWENIDEVAKVGWAAIKKATGTEYIVGSSANAIYIASGGSDDYAFAVANFLISMTMELPAGGKTGFDPPESEIKSSVEESWIGIKAMAERVVQKYSIY